MNRLPLPLLLPTVNRYCTPFEVRYCCCRTLLPMLIAQLLPACLMLHTVAQR